MLKNGLILQEYSVLLKLPDNRNDFIDNKVSSFISTILWECKWPFRHINNSAFIILVHKKACDYSKMKPGGKFIYGFWPPFFFISYLIIFFFCSNSKFSREPLLRLMEPDVVCGQWPTQYCIDWSRAIGKMSGSTETALEKCSLETALVASLKLIIYMLDFCAQCVNVEDITKINLRTL